MSDKILEQVEEQNIYFDELKYDLDLNDDHVDMLYEYLLGDPCEKTVPCDIICKITLNEYKNRLVFFWADAFLEIKHKEEIKKIRDRCPGYMHKLSFEHKSNKLPLIVGAIAKHLFARELVMVKKDECFTFYI